MNETIKPGQLGFSNCKSGWFGKLVKFFTKSNITHCFVCYYPIGDIELIFEANDMIMLTPFDVHYRNNVNQEYEIYEIKQQDSNKIVTKGSVDNALKEILLKYSNVKYGKTQLIWFIWKWLLSKIGIKLDLTKDRKFLTKGILCSELVYMYLKLLDNEIINEELNKFSPNTINAEDLKQIVIRHLGIFELKFKKQ